MIVVFKRKSIVMTLVFLLVICGVSAGFASEEVVAVINNNTTKRIPVYSVETNTKKVALTFDAAWGADKTEGILNTLKKFNVQGTFFLVGFWIDKYPEMVKAIHEYGCDIGNHTENHLDMVKISDSEANVEITEVNRKVKELVDVDIKFLRFPYGSYNTNMVKNVEKNGLIPIQWSVDSLDWKGLSAKEILARVEKGVSDGGIILFHNNSDHILDALPLVISLLQDKGYELVKMSDLVYMQDYTIDTNGVQHQKIN